MGSQKERHRRRALAVPSTATGAFGWSLVNTVVSRFGTLGVGIMLARILGPEEFGTFAIALVALMAVLSFNELGVSLAIVRWPMDPRRIAASVNTISVLGSTVFCVLAWIGAPWFTALMGDPEATLVVRLLMLSVLVNGLVAGPAALLQREFMEKKRLYIDQVNTWLGAALSIGLALAGFGAMALAIGRLAGSAISAVMFLRASPLPYRFGWSREHLPGLIRFGLPLAAASIIVFATGYADQLAAGALLGTTALGFYVLAFNLSSWPVSIVSQPLRRVAPAAFSAIQSDTERRTKVILALFSVVSCATAPAFGALAGASMPLVHWVYGQAWLPAASVLSWLVVAAFSKVLCELAYDYIVVIGRTSVVLKIQGIGLVVSVPLMLLGARIAGLQGIAAAQVVVSFIVLLPLYLWSLRISGVYVSDVLRRIGLPMLAGTGMGVAAWMLAEWISVPLVALLATGLLALLVIGLLLKWRSEDLRSIRGIVRPEAEKEKK